MARVDRKPEIGNGATSQVGKETIRDLDVGAAPPADEMAVRSAREVICGGTMPEMSMHHDAQPLEFLEVPVDSRDRDVRSLGLNLRGQLLSGPVPLGLKKGSDKKAPRRRHATAGGTHTSENLFDVSL